MSTDPTQWIKASASGGSGNCVELRRNGETIEMRDSKDQTGPSLHFTSAELAAFVDGAKRGEFDHLA